MSGEPASALLPSPTRSDFNGLPILARMWLDLKGGARKVVVESDVGHLHDPIERPVEPGLSAQDDATVAVYGEMDSISVSNDQPVEVPAVSMFIVVSKGCTCL
jgi:hypothetical protein